METEEFNQIISILDRMSKSVVCSIYYQKNDLHLLSLEQWTRLNTKLKELKNLKTLCMNNNGIVTIDENFNNLSTLTELNFSNNKIVTIGENLNKLSKLTDLNLSDNEIVTIGENLNQLSELTALNLSNNKIVTIGKNLNNLKKLTTLNLNNNRIITLAEVFKNLSELKVLNLTDATLDYQQIQEVKNYIINIEKNIQKDNLIYILEKESYLHSYDLKGDVINTYLDKLITLNNQNNLDISKEIFNLFKDHKKYLFLSLKLLAYKQVAINMDVINDIKLNNKYISISEILKNNKITEDSFTANGLKKIQDIFNNQNLSNYNLQQLLNYCYYISNNMNLFQELNDSIKNKIKESFDINKEDISLYQTKEQILKEFSLLDVCEYNYLNEHEEFNKIIINKITFNKIISTLDNLNKSSTFSIDLSEKNLHLLSLKQWGILNLKLEEFKTLKHLNLSNNGIVTIGENFKNLTKLTILNLSNNKIETIGENLNNLNELIALDLSNNEIETIGENLNKLSKLQFLYLRNNKIVRIGENFKNLSELTELDFGNNEIVTIGENLNNLKKLKTLNLNNNNIETIDEVFKNLSALETLYITDTIFNYQQIREVKNYIINIKKDIQKENLINILEEKLCLYSYKHKVVMINIYLDKLIIPNNQNTADIFKEIFRLFKDHKEYLFLSLKLLAYRQVAISNNVIIENIELKNKYISISRILKNNKITEDSFTANGLKKIQDIFNNQNLSNYNLQQLLNYCYYISNNMNLFQELNDSIKNKIKESFDINKEDISLYQTKEQILKEFSLLDVCEDNYLNKHIDKYGYNLAELTALFNNKIDIKSTKNITEYQRENGKASIQNCLDFDNPSIYNKKQQDYLKKTLPDVIMLDKLEDGQIKNIVRAITKTTDDDIIEEKNKIEASIKRLKLNSIITADTEVINFVDSCFVNNKISNDNIKKLIVSNSEFNKHIESKYKSNNDTTKNLKKFLNLLTDYNKLIVFLDNLNYKNTDLTNSSLIQEFGYFFNGSSSRHTQNSKDEFITLLKKKGGIDKLYHILFSAGDGCIANMATQLRIALYSEIFKNSIEDQCIFITLYDNILTPIITKNNKKEFNKFNVHCNILTQKLYENYYISVVGFFKAIKEDLEKGRSFIDATIYSNLNLFNNESLNYNKKLKELEALEIENTANAEIIADKITILDKIMQTDIPNIVSNHQKKWKELLQQKVVQQNINNELEISQKELKNISSSNNELFAYLLLRYTNNIFKDEKKNINLETLLSENVKSCVQEIEIYVKENIQELENSKQIIPSSHNVNVSKATDITNTQIATL